ncbi:hypothetical protein TrLO_g10859 [Triparma laevis f. longispina]|uniref:Tyrosine-protein kinase ephrin type A/B receptor-like domain-containing protein n=1 Tax=Triparma laevis f. longispina TaxID=1714387 RepID=A0A9W7AX98_9STRA|nr:hypothetical protein TrLO_g10859 [Triparma laevis f. longispina]
MVAASASCIDCDAGKFGGVASLTCGNCGAGKYSWISSESCTNCSAGKYSAIISANCTSCAAGQFSGAASAECAICAAGKYLSSSDTSIESDACTGCSAGRYNAAPAASSEDDCLICSSGQYSGFAKEKCLSCPAGTHLDRADTDDESVACASCRAGTFSGEAYPHCVDCPAGTIIINRAVGNASLACDSCTMGQFSAPASTKCSFCVPGTHIVVGAVGDEPTVCESCETGLFSGANALMCETCDEGKYIKNSGTGDKDKACAHFYVYYWKDYLLNTIVTLSILATIYVIQKFYKKWKGRYIKQRTDEEMGIGFRAGMELEFEMAKMKERLTLVHGSSFRKSSAKNLSKAEERKEQWAMLYNKWVKAKEKRPGKHNKKILRSMIGLRSVIERNIRHEMEQLEIGFNLGEGQRDSLADAIGGKEDDKIRGKLDETWAKWQTLITHINEDANTPVSALNEDTVATEIRRKDLEELEKYHSGHLIKEHQFLKTVSQTLSYEACLAKVNKKYKDNDAKANIKGRPLNLKIMGGHQTTLGGSGNSGSSKWGKTVDPFEVEMTEVGENPIRGLTGGPSSTSNRPELKIRPSTVREASQRIDVINEHINGVENGDGQKRPSNPPPKIPSKKPTNQQQTQAASSKGLTT